MGARCCVFEIYMKGVKAYFYLALTWWVGGWAGAIYVYDEI